MAQNTDLRTVIIFTQDMQKLSAFYAEGLDIGPYQESPSHLGCNVGSIYFGFDQVDDVQASGGGITVWFTVNDLEAAFAKLVELGAKVRYPPTQKPWGGRLAALYDLDGNMIGLSQRPEE